LCRGEGRCWLGCEFFSFLFFSCCCGVVASIADWKAGRGVLRGRKRWLRRMRRRETVEKR
jgi:hypothetical protein